MGIVDKYSLGCSGVGEKAKPYSLVLGSYQWGKKYFSVYVEKMPKKHSLQSDISMFRVQHW